jgi:hypothetical protein
MSDHLVEKLTLEIFSPLVQSQFKVQVSPTQTAALELVSASEIKSPGLAGNLVQEAFSLLFAGPENQWLAQGSYLFAHERLGKFILFIVPVGKQAGLIQYQAVFNQVRPVA